MDINKLVFVAFEDFIYGQGYIPYDIIDLSPEMYAFEVSLGTPAQLRFVLSNANPDNFHPQED